MCEQTPLLQYLPNNRSITTNIKLFKAQTGCVSLQRSTLRVLRWLYRSTEQMEKKAPGSLLLSYPGWTHQVNAWWQAVNYCTKHQAAGSAHRLGLIFYLHSFLLRISGQFSQLFTVNKLQSHVCMSGRHVEESERPLFWLFTSETRETTSVLPLWTFCWPGKSENWGGGQTDRPAVVMEVIRQDNRPPKEKKKGK